MARYSKFKVWPTQVCWDISSPLNWSIDSMQLQSKSHQFMYVNVYVSVNWEIESKIYMEMHKA